MVWARAGDRAAVILEQYEEFGIENTDMVFFVGLPDSFGGAQVFRNAIREAIAVKTGGERPQGERIPIYTFFPDTAHGMSVIKAERNDPYVMFFSAKGAPQRRAFTGFPTYHNSFLTATLHDFRKTDHTGTALSVVFSKEAIEEFAQTEGSVFLVYYTGETVDAIRIE